MAQCNQCKQDISPQDSFCRYCGTRQGHPKPSKIQIQTGSRSTNIGIGNLPKARINVEHIGDRYDKRISDLIPQIKCINSQLTPIKAAWVGFIGLVGFIGSVASIVGYWRQYGLLNLSASQFPSWVPLLAACSMPIAALGFLLRKGRHILLGRCVLHTDSEGRIVISEVSGACPVPSCPGVLCLRCVREGEQTVAKLICSQYPNRHQFDFYPSELPSREPPLS